MKIYNQIGSKDRLFEMMKNVNKVKLNEDFNANASDILDIEFNGLKNNTLKVQQSNVQASNNKSYVELNCLDEQGNLINFNFEAQATEGDQDGVYNINDVKLIEFKFTNKAGSNTVSIDENGLAQFNSQHGNELVDVISNYADFESGAPEIDESFSEIAKKIDSYPFGGTPRTMQTSKAYADEKPTNPKLRVKSPELEKYIDEDMQTSAAYADEKPTNPKLRVKSPELEKYVNEEDSPVNNLPDNKVQIIKTAINNLKKSGKSSNTSEINVEIKRMLNSGEASLDETVDTAPTVDIKPMSNFKTDDVSKKYYEELPPVTKFEVIQQAIPITDEVFKNLGRNPQEASREEYADVLKRVATKMYQKHMAQMNEDNDLEEGFGKNLAAGALMTAATLGGMNNQAQAAPKFGDKLKAKIANVGGGIQKTVDKVKDRVADFRTQGGGIQTEPPKEETSQQAFERMSKEDGFGQGKSPDQSTAKKIALNNAQHNLATKKAGVSTGNRTTVNANLSGGNITDEVTYRNKDTGVYTTYMVVTANVQNLKEDDGMSFEPSGDEVEQLAQDNEMQNDTEESPLEFDPDQVLAGLRIEMEENPNPMEALEIVMGNLEEDPEYYTVEDDGDIDGEDNDEDIDDEDNINGEEENDFENQEENPSTEFATDDTEDILLGYKQKGDVDEEMIGATGAKPVVDTNTAKYDQDSERKYKEYQAKDFNSLPDNDKEEYFTLWQQFKNK